MVLRYLPHSFQGLEGTMVELKGMVPESAYGVVGVPLRRFPSRNLPGARAERAGGRREQDGHPDAHCSTSADLD